MSLHKQRYVIHYSFGGHLVYVKSKDGNVKTEKKQDAYIFDNMKEVNGVLDLIRESGYGSVEFEEV